MGKDDGSPRTPNHLLGQTSPYLLQHLYNPVDWYPWGPEALERAQVEQKPIFVSIGYAACHWCHVMERESFEDPLVAKFLNEQFVSIKVDREERPDVDEIYMTAVQLTTGSGGWPLNVFLTPELQPFFGGTYFPPDPRYGRPSFLDVLRQLHEAWTGRRGDVTEVAARLTEQVRQATASGPGPTDDAAPVGRTEARRACAELIGRFDARWGGFGPAPKFPPDGGLDLLLREHGRSAESVPLAAVERTLDAICAGGIYDHVGGGFARYSVDDRWLVPHFEKMLYNQALLVPVYVDAWLVTRKPAYRRVVDETLAFVMRELTDSEGGFHSALDADSEGEEGRFYIWTPAEIREVLGPSDGDFFCTTYGITDQGNFEGRNIPSLLEGSLADRARNTDSTEQQLDERLRPLRRALLDVRERRVRPGTDDKVLTSWNGLMISAFARAFQQFGDPTHLAAARRSADFLLARMLNKGRLRVSWRDGTAQLNGYLDDYAFLARGLLDLYEACFDSRYLGEAESLARTMIERFEDTGNGGFWFTSDDHEQLLTRTRSRHDGALPSGSGVATELLLRLGVHLDATDLRDSARRALVGARPAVERMPSAFASLLRAADFAEGPVDEIAIVGQITDARTKALIDTVRERYLPRLAIALGKPGATIANHALLAGKSTPGDEPTAWVCRNYACSAPVTDPGELKKLF